ncbi:hypothetical protein BHM03_00025166 [Ensete ventricosum]|nr:hypothetical protein BHM03_00025166 [Ensete ventricosum]
MMNIHCSRRRQVLVGLGALTAALYRANSASAEAMHKVISLVVFLQSITTVLDFLEGRYYTLVVGANERRWTRLRNKLKVVADSFKILDI